MAINVNAVKLSYFSKYIYIVKIIYSELSKLLLYFLKYSETLNLIILIWELMKRERLIFPIEKTY